MLELDTKKIDLPKNIGKYHNTSLAGVVWFIFGNAAVSLKQDEIPVSKDNLTIKIHHGYANDETIEKYSKLGWVVIEH